MASLFGVPANLEAIAELKDPPIDAHTAELMAPIPPILDPYKEEINEEILVAYRDDGVIRKSWERIRRTVAESLDARTSYDVEHAGVLDRYNRTMKAIAALKVRAARLFNQLRTLRKSPPVDIVARNQDVPQDWQAIVRRCAVLRRRIVERRLRKGIGYLDRSTTKNERHETHNEDQSGLGAQASVEAGNDT